MASKSSGIDSGVLGSVSDMRALAEYAAEQSMPILYSAQRGTHAAAPFIVMPEGKKVQSLKPLLDEYLQAPERRKGTAVVTDLDSLIVHANRFKDEGSVLFARENREQPSLQVVLNYHAAGSEGVPRFGDHRARYDFPLSDEWKAWMKLNGRPMGQGEFAIFMEDRIADVLAPPNNLDAVDAAAIGAREAGGDFGERSPDEQLAYLARLLKGNFAGPTTLMELSRGLSVHADEKVQQAVVTATGEVTMTYAAEHRDSSGGKLVVPSLFLIGIPAFRGDARYRIAVRLRYRLKEGSVMWFYELYRHDAVFDDAFTKACERAAAETGLPLLYGTPE